MPSKLGSSDGVAITDDEAMALAVRAATAWPTALPSLIGGDEEQYRESVKRGARSLLVRSLLTTEDGDRLEPSFQALIDPILDGVGALGTYLADRNLLYLPEWISTAHYRVGGAEYITEVTTPAGVHHLRTRDSGSAHAGTLRLLDAAVVSKLRGRDAGDRDPAFLCIVGSRSADGVRLVSACSTGLSACLHSSDAATVEIVSALESSREAMDYLTSS